MRRWRATRRLQMTAGAGADGDVDERVHSLPADLGEDVLVRIGASVYGPTRGEALYLDPPNDRLRSTSPRHGHAAPRRLPAQRYA
jgi:hypothetical protein